MDVLFPGLVTVSKEDGRESSEKNRIMVMIRNGEMVRKYFKKELRNCIKEKGILFREGRGKRMT